MIRLTRAEATLSASVLCSLLAVALLRAGHPAVWLSLLFAAYLLALLAWLIENERPEAPVAPVAPAAPPLTVLTQSIIVSGEILRQTEPGRALAYSRDDLLRRFAYEVVSRRVQLTELAPDERGNVKLTARLLVALPGE